ncbi:uncharacterized protein SEPMUDRAFT_159612 [Sphaerulina musiva SO2202]|uniref:Uncharacterized protein n=1 Tax=Sphaerulina musiva (strain SO2202) TaxID=692275 RepID=M3CWN9_SPHMS|nr:uncharacterized protein SEPMUDRAFT_159612 [Sphaerulina musiva SO2202]EMF08086.1 hypothetical protein SEPMUDRAFT_159612 [Sphaerulina musiva SO2202]
MQSCREVRKQICQVAPRDLDRFLSLLVEATSLAFHNQGERSVGSAVYVESSHTPSGTKKFEVLDDKDAAAICPSVGTGQDRTAQCCRNNSCAVSTIRGEACCFDRCHRHLVSSGAQPIEEMIVAVAMNCLCDRVGSLHASTSIDKRIGTTQETASRLRPALRTYIVGV